MNDAQLVERLAKTDPVAAAIPLPDGWSADAHLRELEQRMQMQPEATTRPTGSTRPSRRLLPVAPPPSGRGRLGFAAAGIAVAISVVAAAAFIGRAGVLSPAAPATIDGGTALATAERIFAAHNAGDPDAVAAEFLPDAVIEFRGWSNPPTSITLDMFYEWLVWGTAAEVSWVDRDCAVADEGVGTATTVVCEYGEHLPLERAVGAPPAPLTVTAVIAPGRVRQWAIEPGDPVDSALDGNVHPAFGSWMFANHPELDIEFDEQLSIDELRRHGALIGRPAREWGELLEANDCLYPTACFFETPATAGT